jgi:outer membrane protein assembly factor BamB
LLNCAALIYNAQTTDILMNRGNLTRTGLNSTETVLTPALVSSSSFGLLYTKPVDGQVYAQILYVSGQLVIVNGASKGTHNVLYVATENDSLYAFDADSGVQYWKTSVAPAGETSVLSTDLNSTDLQPLIGITSTPVIDRSAGPNGTIFLVAMTKNATTLFYRIHAIDLATGKDRPTPAIVSASVPGIGPADTFNLYQAGKDGNIYLLNRNYLGKFNPNTNGIVWAYERNANGKAVLHAYDATNLKTQLFSSGVISSAVKFAVPTVCNGKVFVGTAKSIAAFGKK